MGADATLVNAAFREAKSRAGATGDTPGVIDQSALYQSTISQGRQFLGAITGAMTNLKLKQEKQDLGIEKQLKGFTDISKRGIRKLYEQKEPLPDKIIFAIEDEIKRLQTEFEKYNTYGKEDTSENERARIKIEGALQRVINEAVNTRAGFMEIFGSIENLNKNEIKSKNIDPMRQVLDLDTMDENDGVTVSVVDGRITFLSENYFGQGDDRWSDEELGAVSMNIGSMIKNLPTMNKQWDIDFGENKKDIQLKSIKDGEIYDFDMATETARIADTIDTEEQFQGVATRRIANAGELSFKESLLNNPNIPISVIQNMFIDDNGERMDIGLVFAELDKNGDNIITEGDSEGLEGDELTNFENNVMAMVDALTNIDNPAFSLATSKQLFSQYYAEVNENTYKQLIDKNIEKGENARKVKTGKDKTGANVLGGWREWDQIDDVGQDIKNKRTHEDLNGTAEWTWDEKKQRWTTPTTDVEGNPTLFEKTTTDLLNYNRIKFRYPDISKEDVNTRASIKAAEEKLNPGKVVKAGDYEPFEGSDGNLISDQQLEIVGKLEDGSIEVRLPDGRVEIMSKPGL